MTAECQTSIKPNHDKCHKWLVTLFSCFSTCGLPPYCFQALFETHGYKNKTWKCQPPIGTQLPQQQLPRLQVNQACGESNLSPRNNNKHAMGFDGVAGSDTKSLISLWGRAGSTGCSERPMVFGGISRNRGHLIHRHINGSCYECMGTLV